MGVRSQNVCRNEPVQCVDLNALVGRDLERSHGKCLVLAPEGLDCDVREGQERNPAPVITEASTYVSESSYSRECLTTSRTSDDRHRLQWCRDDRTLF
ncbi:hypothetical protein XAC1083_760055 [Xanthomonas citri pv. citri]|nr:hypothetical protein XAC1083_760055 [Xanthomonas citri pv. citri]